MTEPAATPEEWRPVPDHPDYDVSNLGRVRSRKRSSTPQLLTNKPHRRLGYCFVRLDGKSYGVHQIVALTFNGPCPEGLEVDHINYVRNDNRPENLRYVTRQQNLADRRWELGDTCSQGHPMSGDNVYIRPSSGRRTCRTCSQQYVRPPTGLVCSGAGCGREADYLVRSPNPVCEMHYQRGRKQAKKQRQLARHHQDESVA